MHDGKYVEIQRRMKSCTKNTLCTHQAVYHRSCYANATNKEKIQRAQERHAHALATGHHIPTKRGQKRGSTELEYSDPSTSGSGTPFTRSCTNPLHKELWFFFCQKDDNYEQLYQVRTIQCWELS